MKRLWRRFDDWMTDPRYRVWWRDPLFWGYWLAGCVLGSLVLVLVLA